MTTLAPVTVIAVGVVVERRAAQNQWQTWSLLPVAVIPGAPAVDGWRVLRESAGSVQYHAATLPLELHRKDTEGYRRNLSGAQPSVYVVMRRDDTDAERPMQPFLVTVCPHEAEAYTVSGSEVVEGVSMPESIFSLVQAFIEQHHVEVPFVKRDRRRADSEADRRRGGAPHGADGRKTR